VTDDGVHDLAAEASPNQLAAAGLVVADITPRTIRQGAVTRGAHYPGGVTGPASRGPMPRKHNPAMSFTFVSGSTQCDNTPALASFDPGVSFAFVARISATTCTTAARPRGDAFLRAFLPQVLAAPDWPHTLLVVSFDEGTTDVGGGGRVFTLVARQGLSGLVSTIPHDHYGLLRTVEDVLGLPSLGAACNATPLDEFLR